MDPLVAHQMHYMIPSSRSTITEYTRVYYVARTKNSIVLTN